jgi:hypothetical protein
MLKGSCAAARKDGNPCQATPTHSGYCFAHNPALSSKRREARVKGGKGKSRTVRAQKLLPDDLQVLDTLLDRAIAGVYQGALLPAQGTSIASLVGAKVRLREVSLKIAEQVELKEEVAALERRLGEIETKSGTNGKGAGFPFRR